MFIQGSCYCLVCFSFCCHWPVPYSTRSCCWDTITVWHADRPTNLGCQNHARIEWKVASAMHATCPRLRSTLLPLTDCMTPWVPAGSVVDEHLG